MEHYFARLHPEVAARELDVREWAGEYERLRPTLVRALVAATGSYEGVDDAIQDAFEEALRRTPGTHNLSGWIYTVALNRIRRAHRRGRLFANLFDPPAASRELDDAALRIDLIRVLARLSPRERELLVAKYYLGMTQDEIASALKVPRGTVSAAISRASARLKQMESDNG